MLWKKKTIQVRFVDVDTGKPFAQTECPPDQLPQSFEAHTTLNMEGQDWEVVSADPITRAEYVQRGQQRAIDQRLWRSWARKSRFASFSDWHGRIHPPRCELPPFGQSRPCEMREPRRVAPASAGPDDESRARGPYGHGSCGRRNGSFDDTRDPRLTWDGASSTTIRR
jgi:hypothetical protein